MTAEIWSPRDGIALQNALAHFLAQRGWATGDPRWLLSDTDALVALAGAYAVKAFARNLGQNEHHRLVTLDLSLTERLPVGRALSLGRLYWSVGGEIRQTRTAHQDIDLLLMRRMPDDSNLLGLSRRNAVTESCGTAIGALLKSFHALCPVLAPSPGQTGIEQEEQTLGEDLAAFDGLERLVAKNRLERLQSALIDRAPEAHKILSDRAKNGCRRDIHGDAHMENIWFVGEHPTLLDPMPSNRRRQADILRDIARVTLELNYLQQDGPARAFLRSVTEQTPEEESVLRYFLMRLSLGDIIAWSHRGPNNRTVFFNQAPLPWRWP
ncbi:MAG: hypothetical protein ACPGOY_14670 [Rhodospirillaceae bacterium]